MVKILAGDILHPNLVALSAKLVTAGMDRAAVENFLRGLMEKSAAAQDKRWQERYDDIPRIVASAEAKFAPEPAGSLAAVGEVEGPAAGSTAGSNAGNSVARIDGDDAGVLDKVNEQFSDFDAWARRCSRTRTDVARGGDDRDRDRVANKALPTRWRRRCCCANAAASTPRRSATSA